VLHRDTNSDRAKNPTCILNTDFTFPPLNHRGLLVAYYFCYCMYL